MEPKSRLERRKAKTKDAIFQVAIELFLKQGYDNTTVDQIVETVDIAKGTFFNYFPTKDAIIYYLGEQRVVLMQNILENELKNVTSAKEKIYTWLKIFGQANERDRKIVGLIVNVVFTKLFTDAKTEWQTQKEVKDILTEIVREGQLAGEFCKDIEPQHVADILISIYFFTLFQWLENILEKSLTEEYLARAEIIMSGIVLNKKA